MPDNHSHFPLCNHAAEGREASRRAFLHILGGFTAGISGLGASNLLGQEVQEQSVPGAQNGPSQDIPAYRTDVLVCGGGPSGMAAAVLAARQGCKVLLVERYGRLGGMAVHGLVGPLMGGVQSPFVDEVLRRIGGRHADPNRLDVEYATLIQEAGAKLLLHAWIIQASGEPGQVSGVVLASKQGLLRVEASVVVDATGDGDVAFSAGAEFEQGRPGDGLMQPMSIMYHIAGVDESSAFTCGSEEEARSLRLPDGTWEEIVTRGQKTGELQATIGVIRLYRTQRPGERIVNATQVNNVDGTKVEDLTRAELEGRRQALQVVTFLQKHAPGYGQAYITRMPAVIGVRETRRFLGLQQLTRGDVEQGKRWPDAVVRGASFPIDIHNPLGSGQAEGQDQGVQGAAARAKPYDIPYGCLVPRKIDGLLLAGRCISGTHEAHASYRVQCIAMAIGAAAGAAAALATAERCQPRAVPAEQVQKLLGYQG